MKFVQGHPTSTDLSGLWGSSSLICCQSPNFLHFGFFKNIFIDVNCCINLKDTDYVNQYFQSFFLAGVPPQSTISLLSIHIADHLTGSTRGWMWPDDRWGHISPQSPAAFPLRGSHFSSLRQGTRLGCVSQAPERLWWPLSTLASSHWVKPESGLIGSDLFVSMF